MKKKIILLFFVLFVTHVFAEDIVISRENLIRISEETKDSVVYTPDELCRRYENNGLRFEEEFDKKAFLVGGKVVRLRRGLFDEYIVELKCMASWVSDLAIVYPTRISPSMKETLMNLTPGQYYKALVVGRKSWYYVDVPVWNNNGVYRTTP